MTDDLDAQLTAQVAAMTLDNAASRLYHLVHHGDLDNDAVLLEAAKLMFGPEAGLMSDDEAASYPTDWNALAALEREADAIADAGGDVTSMLDSKGYTRID